MKVVSSLRSLVDSKASSSPSHREYAGTDEFGRTVHDAAFNGTPAQPARSPAEDRAGVALPGDIVESPQNPFLGKNPQYLANLVRSGRLNRDDADQVRQALVIYQGFTGEQVMWSQAPDPDVEREPGMYVGPGCTAPDPVSPKLSSGAGSGSRRSRQQGPAYAGSADPMPEHELDFLWR